MNDCMGCETADPDPRGHRVDCPDFPKLAKCPPITAGDIQKAVYDITMSRMEKARHLKSVGELTVAHDLSKVVQLLDVSKTVRGIGNGDGADALIEQARELILDLLGIKVDLTGLGGK